MVQPRYSPEEALERVKLMMKYDSSKTLNENKEVIFEQTDTQRVALGAATAGAAGGAVAGGIIASPAFSTAPVNTGLGRSAYEVTRLGRFLLGQGARTGAAAALGGATIVSLAGLALVPLAYWLITKDTGANKVKKFFEMCSSEGAKIAKLQRKIDEKTIRDMSDDINDAVNYNTLGFLAGTDEEKLFAQFKKIQDGTASDFCALVNQYNKNYGDLYDDLDSDIDSEDEWDRIFRPLRNCVEDSLLQLGTETQKDCKSNPEQNKCKKIASLTYKDCKDSYRKGCKTTPEGAVGKIQGCLGGLKVDGLFGPRTESKLKEKFPEFASGFKDSDVDKICAQSSETVKKTKGPGDEEIVTQPDVNVASKTEPF